MGHIYMLICESDTLIKLTIIYKYQKKFCETPEHFNPVPLIKFSLSKWMVKQIDSGEVLSPKI